MDATTVHIGLLLAAVAGFGTDLAVGGVAGRGAEAAFRARLVRREVRAVLARTATTTHADTLPSAGAVTTAEGVLYR